MKSPHTHKQTTNNDMTLSEIIAAPVGAFGKDFDYSPRPIAKHPFVCNCEHCKRRHEERKMERELVKIRLGV